MALNRKNLAHKVLSESIFAQTTNLITVVFSFFKAYVFTKVLTLEEYGILTLLITMSGFLLYFLTFGTFQYLFKTVANKPEDKINSFWTSMIVTLTLSGLTLFFTGYFGDDLARVLDLTKYKNELFLLILSAVITAIFMLFSFYIYGHGKNNLYNLTQLLRNSFWILLAITYLLLFKETNLFIILITINIAIILTLIYSLLMADVRFLLKVNFRRLNFKPLFEYCTPLIPYFFCIWGIPLIIRAQLNIGHGGEFVAIFSIAYTLMDFIFILASNNIVSTFAPYFYADLKDDKDRPIMLYNSMLRFSILIVLCIVPFVYLLRYEIILFVTKREYLAALDYLPYLLVLPLLRTVILTFHQYFLRNSLTLYLGVVYSLAIVLTFFISKFLIFHHAIYGAVFTTLFVYFFLFITFFYRQKNMLNNHFLKVGPLLQFSILICLSIMFLDPLPLQNYFKIVPLAIAILLGINFIPVLADNERAKIFAYFKIK